MTKKPNCHSQIIPLFDRIILSPINEPQSQNGILIPKSQKDKSHQMQVIATGPDTVANLKSGDIVIVHKYAGTELNIGDSQLFIIKECDILAIKKV